MIEDATRKDFAAKLRAGETVFVAGCFDAMSAMLAEKAGSPAVMTSGFAVSATHLGFPDVELYTMTENLTVVRHVVNAVGIPVIADTDTGYGNAINVMRTVREFEQAGVSAMIFEDQLAPKRCPAAANKVELLSAYEHAGKIRAAGVSNFKPHDWTLLQSAMSTPLVTNQIEISLGEISAFTNGDIAFHQQHAHPIMAWSPLGGGVLMGIVWGLGGTA